jgi:hypothetical protein
MLQRQLQLRRFDFELCPSSAEAEHRLLKARAESHMKLLQRTSAHAASGEARF